MEHGTCATCGENRRTEHQYVKGEYVWTCVFCRAESDSMSEIRQATRTLDEMTAIHSKLRDQVIPALRRDGIEPASISASRYTGITVRIPDRKIGMKAAGSLGALTGTPRRWKREQEYGGKTLKFSAPLDADRPYGPEIEITGVTPSANCKVVEYEEEIPARKVKKYKVVCEPPESDTVESGQPETQATE